MVRYGSGQVQIRIRNTGCTNFSHVKYFLNFLSNLFLRPFSFHWQGCFLNRNVLACEQHVFIAWSNKRFFVFIGLFFIHVCIYIVYRNWIPPPSHHHHLAEKYVTKAVGFSAETVFLNLLYLIYNIHTAEQHRLDVMRNISAKELYMYNTVYTVYMYLYMWLVCCYLKIRAQTPLSLSSLSVVRRWSFWTPRSWV